MSGNDKISRKIYLLRHAERVDFIMPQWYNTCFDAEGNYLRKDLNMPKSIPPRKDGPRGWIKDTPLSNVGVCQARLIGDSMKDKNITIDAVYVSPAFRCIQTADTVLQELGLKETLPLRIEPGLYEWTGFVESHFPQLYTPQELSTFGFNIDLSYQPQLSNQGLRDCLSETVPDLYRRNHTAMLHVLNETHAKNPSGNVLIVVHAISLETCTRFLLGKSDRPWSDLKTFFGKVGLCSMVALEECNKKYTFVEPPGGPITQSSNDSFDWRIFLDA
uniref:CSON000130 protein n=1 Tax=Culicoides sonorensis TaxID=179676 RepID=A0A336MHS4_CULSO